MKPAELSKKTSEELQDLLVEQHARRDELEFMILQKKAKNVKELRETKKDIARILTILNRGTRI